MASERDTPRGATQNGASQKSGVNGTNGSKRLSSLFGVRSVVSTDTAAPEEQSGPAYQHLRETLRDLIGDAEPDDQNDALEPATQRRRGYVSPSRAGITPPLSADDNASAAENEDAIPPATAAMARPGNTARVAGERPYPAKHSSAGHLPDEHLPAEHLIEVSEPARAPVRTGLKAKLRAERRGADAPLIRRDLPPVQQPLEVRDHERRRIEIEDEPQFKKLPDVAISSGNGGPTPASRESTDRNFEDGQLEARGDTRSVSRLRHRRPPQKAEYTVPAETERVNDDELWTGRGLAIATPARSRLRLIAFGLGGVVLMGAGIFLGARIFAPAQAPTPVPASLAAAPAKPLPAAPIEQPAVEVAAAVPAGAASPKPVVLEPEPAPAVVSPLKSASEPAKSVAVVTAETGTLADGSSGAAPPVAIAAAVPAEPAKLPAVAEPVPVEPLDAASAATPGIAADAAGGEQPADGVPGIAAEPAADVSAPADSADAVPADAEPAAGEDQSAAASGDGTGGGAAPPAGDPPPEDTPPAAAPPPETRLAVLSIAPKPGAAACEPAIQVAPLRAGFSRIAIDAACMASQPVRFTYGGVVFDRQLDDAGALYFDVDCFLGSTEPIAIAFKTGAVYQAVPTALDLDKVAKVAVVWNAAVDIDLHAYEYPSDQDPGRHVWASAPASIQDIVQLIRADQRGAGYMSSIADARGTGSHVEVYTFVYPLSAGRRGAGDRIKFAVDYSTRGSRPKGSACGDGSLASLDYQLLISVRGARPSRALMAFTALPCDATIADQVRYNTQAFPELNLSK